MLKRGKESSQTVQMQLYKRKSRVLEESLIQALASPYDSEQRTRYIKRLIYGEAKVSKEDKSLGARIRQMLK